MFEEGFLLEKEPLRSSIPADPNLIGGPVINMKGQIVGLLLSKSPLYKENFDSIILNTEKI